MTSGRKSWGRSSGPTFSSSAHRCGSACALQSHKWSFERLDGTYEEADPKTGQFPLYGKVAGVIITGNEDGAHSAAATTLFNLTHLGCAVPPNADCYWTGESGPGPSYIEAGGDRHLYTNKTARYLANNVAFLARLLKEHPIPTDLKELTMEAERVGA